MKIPSTILNYKNKLDIPHLLGILKILKYQFSAKSVKYFIFSPPY